MSSALWVAGVVGLGLLTAMPADAEVELCRARAFPAARGVMACSGAAQPLVVTATVRTYARLALAEVFGSQATSLQIALGAIDAHCVSTPEIGVSCVADDASAAATWYGNIRFRVKLTGVGSARAKLTGLRPTAGTIPTGRLLDGPPDTAPTRAYPIEPAGATDLQAAIGAGETLVSRSVGLRVTAADPAQAWSGNAVFSLVLE